MSRDSDSHAEDSDTSRFDMSAKRTDFAEDRTVLANERTFAGWFRTGFASVAIGLGFQALFLRMDPPWVPKAIATLFLALGIFLFVAAERRACQVLEQLSTHSVKQFGNHRLRVMTIAASVGVLALIVAMWTLPLKAEKTQPPETAQEIANAVN